MAKCIVEVCCGSYYDAKMAVLGGATRIELNSALHLGGLTPSVGTLQLIKDNFDLEVLCMVRPRGAGFCYNDEDFLIMMKDATILLENGADGIVFGFLKNDYEIDIVKTRLMVELIKKYNKIAVFHRAIDCTVDIYKGMSQLIDLGVDRVLTSGQKDKAMESLDLIKQIQANYGEQIEIVVGSGVNADNVAKLILKTSVNQVHSSCKEWVDDLTTSNNEVSFAYNGYENKYDVVSAKLVEKIIEEANCLNV